MYLFRVPKCSLFILLSKYQLRWRFIRLIKIAKIIYQLIKWRKTYDLSSQYASIYTQVLSIRHSLISIINLWVMTLIYLRSITNLKYSLRWKVFAFNLHDVNHTHLTELTRSSLSHPEHYRDLIINLSTSLSVQMSDAVTSLTASKPCSLASFLSLDCPSVYDWKLVFIGVVNGKKPKISCLGR